MFKSTQEFDSAMKKTLVVIRDGENVNSLPSDDDSLEAIVECINRGLLQGITYDRTMDGKPHFSQINPRVTYSGLSFIESH